MFDASEDRHVSYAHKASDLAHEELTIPDDAPAWVRDMVANKSIAKASEALWTAVMDFETHPKAQLAGELEMALPKELTLQEQIDLTREFIRESYTAKGMIADWVIHNPDGNPHVHVMHTLRPLVKSGFGDKRTKVLDTNGEPVRVRQTQTRRGTTKVIETFKYVHFAGYKSDLKPLRQSWETIVNRHLALAGHDARIDMRSYADQGIALPPTTHIGPRPNAIAKTQADILAVHDNKVSKTRQVRAIERDPAALLHKIGGEQSTFTERDIARQLNCVVDDPVIFHEVMACVRASAELVRLRDEIRDSLTDELVAPAVFSTRTILRSERAMAHAVDRLAQKTRFGVCPKRMAASIRKVETADPDQSKHFKFTHEQVAAVAHITSGSGVAALVGFAGAGKSTLLAAANLAWGADGRRVFGAALAGKAAEGLEESSDIQARTLASWELAWSKDRDRLARGDVFVIDEAGMVGSAQLSRVAQIIAHAGAKLVLVGDAKQLQPIEAGAAFRAITDRIGYVELSGIQRQKAEWARNATRQFARGQVTEALAAYRDQGHIRDVADPASARTAIVGDWLAAHEAVSAKAAASGKSLKGDELLVLAATNADVFALNTAIRTALIGKGALPGRRTVKTERGERTFATGDRMIFLKNEAFIESAAKELGRQRVKNGMLGTVVATDRGLLRVRLDSGRELAFTASTYRNIDHGYASTVHKSQGVTVDRVFVMGSKGFDQHLSYVAMTRHRHQATLYAAKSDFPTFDKMTKAMGRSREKSTTLDFESEGAYQAVARQFLERRGIDTLADIVPAFQATLERQRERLMDGAKQVAALWDRAQAALRRKRARETPALAPTPTTLDQALMAQRGQIKALATKVFGSATPIEALIAKGEQQPKSTATLTVAALSASAPLAGKMTGLFGTKPDAAHQTALAAQPELVAALKDYAVQFAHAQALKLGGHVIRVDLEGHSAKVAFPADKTADRIFRNALGNITPKLKDGIYEFALPQTDAKFRTNVISKIETAARAVEPRMVTLADGGARAQAIIDQAPKFTHVTLEVKNNALAVKIGFYEDAITTIKSIGADWVPKVAGHSGYWTVQVEDANHASRIQNAVAAADTALAAQAAIKSPATVITSPHAEITLSTRGATLFVKMPRMVEISAILTADGPAAMTWDRAAGGFAVTVTPDNATAVTKRLKAVSSFYETQTLVPPLSGKPGLAKPDGATLAVITTATVTNYQSQPEVRAAIDAVQAKIVAAFMPDERAALARHSTSTPAGLASERLAALSPHALQDTAELVRAVANVLAQNKALQRAQSQTKAKGIGL